MKILILLGTILQLKVVLPHGKKMIKEDIEFLEDWIVQIKTLTKELNLIAQKKDLTTYFSISNTTSSSKNIQKPYVTPIRLLEGGVICGVVVFSQSQAVIAAKFVQDLVDKILVDSEKKLECRLTSIKTY